MVSIIADISLIKIYDLVSKTFISDDTKKKFSIISIVCLSTQFVLLIFIRRPKLEVPKLTGLFQGRLYQLTKAVQFLLSIVLVYIILQIFLFSYYYTLALFVIIVCSYILSISILVIFISKIITLNSFRRNTFVMILFIFAIGSVTFNIAVAMIDASLRIGDRPDETRFYIGGSSDISKGRYNVIDNLYFVSFIISFISSWIASATLLSYYSDRIGITKYYLLISSPILFFLGQFAFLFADMISLVLDVDMFFLTSLVNLIAMLSKPLGGLMLACCFWTMAMSGKIGSLLRNYLIISGFGFLLLFTSNQAILMSIAPYPPFGIGTVTVMGVVAYLMVIGIYVSSISISHNVKLGESIRQFANSQSKLIHSIATIEKDKKIQEKVMEIIKKQTNEFERETGVILSY